MRSIHEVSLARGRSNKISAKSKAVKQSAKEDRFLGRLLYGATGFFIVVMFAAMGILTNAAPSTNAVASDSQSTIATVRVTSSCSMSANPFSTDTDHVATLVNGQAKTDGIGITTIKTTCNDLGGYSIYAVGYSDDILGDTNLVSANVGSSNIPTGTTLDGTVSNWAMRIGIPTVTHDTTYDPTIVPTYATWAAVPSTYQKVASYDSGVVPSTGGSYITTTYAASISPTQTAGTYVGKVKYTLVHPSISEITTDHDMQHVDDWAGELLVGDSVIATDSRDGKTYSVARLCMNRNGCDTSTPDFENSMLWMTQNLDLTLSPSTELNSGNTNLTDYKDYSGNVFAGYRYNNGVIYWTPGSTLTTSATINGTPVAGNNENMIAGWTNSNVYPYQAEAGDRYNYTSGSSAADTIYTSLAECKAALINAGKASSEAQAEELCKHYHIGNYYNYTASVAMNDSSSIADWHENAPNSICPAGWRLPKGLQNNAHPNQSANVASEYNQMLYANYITDTLMLDDGTGTGWPNAGYANNGFIAIRQTPVWLSRSGNVDGAALNGFATNGLYWSSTSVTVTIAYDLAYHSGELRPAARTYHNYGFSLRCVHDDQVKTIDKLTYMQDFAKLSSLQMSQVKESMTEGEQYKLKDSRDESEYWVAKQADGKIWMTQNLDLVLSPSKPLTSNDTNLTRYKDANGNFSGYSYNNGVITWTPNSTLATPATINGTPVAGNNENMIAGWTNSNITPYQAEAGDRYNYTSGSNADDIIYTSLAECRAGVISAGKASTEAQAEELCKHYHLGNYYNYTASIAMNDSSSIADWHENGPNSICPAGWRLPKGLQNPENPTQSATVASEYNQMLYTNHITNTLKLDDGTDTGWPNAGYASNGFVLIRQTPVWLSRSGNVNGAALNNFATLGLYWSSTSVTGSIDYCLEYTSGALGPAARYYRYGGLSLRCIAN